MQHLPSITSFLLYTYITETIHAVMVRIVASCLNSQQYVSKTALYRVWQRKQLKKTNDLHFRASTANAISRCFNTAIESSNKPRLTNYLKTPFDMF